MKWKIKTAPIAKDLHKEGTLVKSAIRRKRKIFAP
jgi:hypothetical protein